MLETNRLLMTSPTIQYAADTYEYSSDSEFCKYLATNPPSHINESIEFLKNLVSDNSSGKRCYWMLLLKNEKKAIGTMGFIFNNQQKIGEAEFGYGIGKKYWGKGLFKESAMEIINHGFNILGFNKIRVITRIDNLTSIKAVEKLGFTKMNVLKDYYNTSSGKFDSVILELNNKIM